MYFKEIGGEITLNTLTLKAGILTPPSDTIPPFLLIPGREVVVVVVAVSKLPET